MASPHVAGLLAYLLSLQPSKDSAYAVADITPKKLKANLIEIGTVGALSDVPSNTKNILAWNGGGVSNFTEIVEKGGYAAKKSVEETDDSFTITIPSVATVEKDIEAEFNKAKAATGRKGNNLHSKLNKIEADIEDFVAEEMEELFSEFKARVARE
jgi:cerevisin